MERTKHGTNTERGRQVMLENRKGVCPYYRHGSTSSLLVELWVKDSTDHCINPDAHKHHTHMGIIRVRIERRLSQYNMG
uniref:Uncharacterized protein n=6 Tax=Oryza TaxID=4527 RepID=A0A0D3FN05_9ORYZ